MEPQSQRLELSGLSSRPYASQHAMACQDSRRRAQQEDVEKQLEDHSAEGSHHSYLRTVVCLFKGASIPEAGSGSETGQFLRRRERGDQVPESRYGEVREGRGLSCALRSFGLQKARSEQLSEQLRDQAAKQAACGEC